MEQPVSARTSDQPDTAEQSAESGAGTPGNNSPSSDDAASANYEPPFPERENPFLAPKRGANSIADGVGNSDDEIQLLGFANVTGQKAIFSINGMVVPIGEGGMESGIEVISIQPPAVVLQRNRQRWQASLQY